MPDDTLILCGGPVKALDDAGRFGGHLVMFGDPEHPDLSEQKDYFTADTDYWKDFPATLPTIYAHGRDRRLQRRRIGVAEVKADDAGLWLEGQLALRDDYERKVWGMVKAGKLGLSSGSAGHLVDRDKQSNGTHKVISWPLVEASLTPTPAEPRILVRALKSLGLDGADPAPSLAESLDELDSGVRGMLPRFERAMRVREGQGRHLSAEKVAGLKALRDDIGRLIAIVEAPDRAAEARRRLTRALLGLAIEGTHS